jgi:AcrR family transcriptional regulator
MTETENKILDAAERLFSEQGYAATSLRHIIADAGVNLAAIHYHFGSKEDLLSQLIMRKAAPVNEERLALLDRLEAEAGPNPPPVEKILEAFLAPPLRRIQVNPALVKLMGRMYGEGLMPMIAERHFQNVVNRFTTSFGRALPQLSGVQLKLRLQFMVGAMAHSMFVLPVTSVACSGAEYDAVSLTRELVSFLSAGLRAPAPRPVAIEETSR